MFHIDSYNSSYPLAYYNIGTVYSFYGQPSQKGTQATAEQVRKYGHMLDQLNEEKVTSAIQPMAAITPQNAPEKKLNRFYAVVVDKTYLSGAAFIVVMFCNFLEGKTEYLTKYYSVNKDCLTNDKDLMPVSSHLTMNSKQGKNIKEKTGGITLADQKKKTGGITRTGKSAAPSSVGGITRVHQSCADEDIQTGRKTGGITLAKGNRVGGITRVKR